MDREKVIKEAEEALKFLAPDDKHRLHMGIMMKLGWIYDALALLKEQEALLHEYEKLSQVCFKIEKYLRIADLSILIDRIEEGKVEVLQDDGRPDAMETTIKIRRL